MLMVVSQEFYTTRGTPLSAYHRVRELSELDVEVDILTYGVGGDPPEAHGRVFRAWGPHFARTVRPGPSVLKIWFDVLLFVSLLARLATGRYDVLYGHEDGAFMCLVAGRLFGIPYVYDMHSSLPLQITEWEFSKRRWVIGLFEWVEAVTIRNASAVVTIAPALAHAARTICRDANVVTIVNYYGHGGDDGADGPEDIRARHGIPAEAPLVVYTGSFVALQALDMLVEAVGSVAGEVEGVHFLLVGGQDAQIEELQKLVDAQGVADRVRLVPIRPQSEMSAYMAAADVLVSPRVRGINPPGKLFSYLASGKPVVAPNTLVHNQLLSEACAILTEPTAEGLAAGLITALTDDEGRDRVRRGAARFLELYCNDDRRQAAYEKVIGAVASGRGVAPDSADGPRSQATLPLEASVGRPDQA